MLGVVAGIVLTPIYTRFFSKEEFGIMDLANTWNNFMILVVPLGLSTAVLRLYKDFSESEEEKKKNLGTLLVSLLISCGLYLILSSAGLGFLNKFYYNNAVDYEIILLSYGIVICTVLVGYFQTLNRIQFSLYKYISVNISSFLILMSLGYYLSVSLNFRIVGFFYAGLISSIFALLLSIVLGRKNVFFSFDLKVLKPALIYSLPLVFVLFLYNLTNIVDRFIIQNMLSLADNGDYSVVQRINGLFKIFISSFSVAWIPFAIVQIDKPKRNSLYRKAYKHYLQISGVLLILIIIFTKEILLIFAPDYLNIELFVYIILMASQVHGLNNFFGLGILVSKKSHYSAISIIASVVVNVLVSILLTWQFGLIGIVIGTYVAILSYVLVDKLITQKIINLRFSILPFLMNSLILSILIAVVFLFNKLSLTLTSSILIKAMFASLILAFAFKFLNLYNHLKPILNKFLNK